MANYPPFMNATGVVSKILTKVLEAQTPERFTQDFLATKLGFPSGSARAFIPIAKRLGLLSSDGAPTDLYKRFRNPRQSKAAMAEAIRSGYADLYARNEYAHDLNRTDLDGLIMETTGLKKNHQTLKAIRGTFEGLKGFADFGAKSTDKNGKDLKKEEGEKSEKGRGDVGEISTFGISYNINLILPKTDDIAVFNSIFKSLKENLLKK